MRLSGEMLTCDACGTPTPIELIDGKDDGTGDYNRLECRDCYGPGWCPSTPRISMRAKGKPMPARKPRLGRGEAAFADVKPEDLRPERAVRVRAAPHVER